MFETDAEDDELAIPPNDDELIESYGTFIADQLRHQYRLGIIRGLRLAESRVKDTEKKYGR